LLAEEAVEDMQHITMVDLREHFAGYLIRQIDV